MVFEREARELTFSCFLQIVNCIHFYHLYNSFISEENHSNAQRSGSCWTDYHVHPSTHSASDVGTVTPQACYERCIQRYGAGNCAGFDTRANCRLYSFSGYVDTNRITTTRNCAVNGNAANCDEWTGSDCYAVIIEDTSTRRTDDMLNMTCFKTSMNGEGTTFWNGFGT